MRLTIPAASIAYSASASPLYPTMMMPNGMFWDAANACNRFMSRPKSPVFSACQSTSMCRKAGGTPRARSNCTMVSIASALEKGYASIRPILSRGYARATVVMYVVTRSAVGSRAGPPHTFARPDTHGSSIARYASVPPAFSIAFTASSVERIDASMPLASGVHQNSLTDPASSAVLIFHDVSFRNASARTSASYVLGPTIAAAGVCVCCA